MRKSRASDAPLSWTAQTRIKRTPLPWRLGGDPGRLILLPWTARKWIERDSDMIADGESGREDSPSMEAGIRVDGILESGWDSGEREREWDSGERGCGWDGDDPSGREHGLRRERSRARTVGSARRGGDLHRETGAGRTDGWGRRVGILGRQNCAPTIVDA